MLDAIIVGGGPAGLSAALALGRCRRTVLVCDKGEPRNAASLAMHGYLTRDGIAPSEFLRLGREEILRYPTVKFLGCEVVSVERNEQRFIVQTNTGEAFSARILLLATGLVDDLPPIPGVEKYYGKSVHPCPYCDGWEHRDQAIAVCGKGQEGVDLALKMRRWSSQVVFCPNQTEPEEFPLNPAQEEQLCRAEIPIRRGKVVGFEGQAPEMSALVFADGSRLPCHALFFPPSQRQRSELALKLGCHATESQQIECQDCQESNIPGVFVIGNAAEGQQLVIMAAAAGTRAGFAIDEALHFADL
jgi:thioredoxin reductase